MRNLMVMILAVVYCWPCAAADWPTYHGDAGLRGLSTAALPESLSVRWSLRTGSPIALTPIVGSNLIYVAQENGTLLAVDQAGHQVWSSRLDRKEGNPQGNEESFSTPPLWLAGSVVIGSDQGILRAYDAATGLLRWSRKVGREIFGAPNTAPEGAGGIIVMSRQDGCLKRMALDSGDVTWAAQPVSRCDASPAAGAGVAVFGACDSAVHILSLKSGEQTGLVKLGDRGPMAGGTALDGHQAFIGTRDGSVVCIDVQGAREVWASRCASNEVFTTPAVTSTRVIVASTDGKVYCLNRNDGAILWQMLVEGNPSSPVVAGDKVVVTSEGRIFLMSLKDGRRLWSAEAGDSATSPAVSGNAVIVGTDDGFLVLYGPAPDKKETP